jgi:hypothetical protein
MPALRQPRNFLLRHRLLVPPPVPVRSSHDLAAESDIARARRMLEIATSIPREEIVV